MKEMRRVAVYGTSLHGLSIVNRVNENGASPLGCSNIAVS